MDIMLKMATNFTGFERKNDRMFSKLGICEWEKSQLCSPGMEVIFFFFW